MTCIQSLQKEKEVAEKLPFAKPMKVVTALSGVALFVIGCLGAAGILPGSTVGWVAIGLGAGTLILNLAQGKLKDRKITLILAALGAVLPITLGALGVTGVLSGTQLGYGIIIAPFVTIGAGLFTGCCVGCGIACCLICGKDEEDASSNGVSSRFPQNQQREILHTYDYRTRDPAYV